MVRRSPHLLIGMLGILKAGGAFLPLATDYPPERLAYMLHDSQAGLLLTEEDLVSRLWFRGDWVNVRAATPDVETSPIQESSGADLAYVIYTSGSTGRPKGVMIEHKSVIHFIAGVRELIPVTAQKRIVASTSVSFDPFVLEMLLPLALGLCVVMADEEEQRNPGALCRLLVKERVQMFQTTPSRLLWILSDKGCTAALGNLSELMIGGEALSPVLLKQLRRITYASIYNLYGFTETTVWCSVKDVTRAEAITVGKPILKTRFYVVDGQGCLARPGTSGELCIAGDGLGRGYIGQSTMTSDRFVPNPFEGADQLMYRTGDLARQQADGEFILLGRADHQVKIFGHRIELGEVESTLLEMEQVRSAAAVAREIEGQKVLCAYVVVDDGTKMGAVREFARRKLPHYMVPSYFASLAVMPLTPSGKVDRNALPPLCQDISESQGDDVLSSLFRFVAGLVGQEDVRAECNIFDLGVDSLGAMALLAWIHKRFNAALPIRALLRAASLADLARLVKESTSEASVAEEESMLALDFPLLKDYPLSPAQRSYMAVCMPFGNSSACNVLNTFVVKGSLSDASFIRAMEHVIGLHDSLRSCFLPGEGEIRQRFLEPPLPIQESVQILELQGLSVLEQQAAVEGLVTKMGGTEIGVFTWPLYRATLIRLSPECHLVVVVIHHLVSDGYSLDLFQAQFREFILAEQEGRPPVLQSVPMSYRRVIYMQEAVRQGDGYGEARQYWLKQFAGRSQVTFFPVDRALGTGGGLCGGYLCGLPADLAMRCRQNHRQLRCSLLTYLLAVYILLICEVLERQGVAISVPLAGRHRDSFLHVIGLFATLGLVIQRVEPQMRLSDLVRDIDEQMIGMQTHMAYQYHDLMQDLGISIHQDRFPITSVMFNQERLPVPVATHVRECGGRHRDLGRSIRFDLQALLRSDEDTVALDFIYRKDVLGPEQVEQLASRYLELLARAVPEVEVGQLIRCV